MKRNPTAFMGTTAIIVNQSVEIRSQVHNLGLSSMVLGDVFNFTLVECLIPPLPCGICIRREHCLCGVS